MSLFLCTSRCVISTALFSLPGCSTALFPMNLPYLTDLSTSIFFFLFTPTIFTSLPIPACLCGGSYSSPTALIWTSFLFRCASFIFLLAAYNSRTHTKKYILPALTNFCVDLYHVVSSSEAGHSAPVPAGLSQLGGQWPDSQGSRAVRKISHCVLP